MYGWLVMPVQAGRHRDEVALVAQDVDAVAQLRAHRAGHVVEPPVMTAVAAPADHGDGLGQLAVLGLQLGQVPT